MSTRIVHRLLCKIPVRNPKLQRAFSVMRTTHPRSAKPLFTLSCQSQRQLATTTKNHKDDDGDKSKKDGKESHADFEKQLLELQEERQLLFGEVSDEPTFVASDTQHSEFEKQLRDMNEERVQLFGDEDTKLEQHITKEAEEGTTEEEEEEEEMEAQLYRLKVEREEVFGFTHKEHTAWSNLSSGTEKLPASLMEEIEQARANADATQEETLEASPQASNDNAPSKSIPAHGLTHLSEDGTSVNMVDVGDKAVTQRIARAETKVVFPPEVVETFQLNSTNDNELVGPKGPIFATAKLAGIMAAKKTSELIPLCHPLPLDKVQVDIQLQNSNVALISCECRVTHKTGVEMEALTGASVAALTIYDMVKAISHNIRIEETVLVSKSGGKRLVGPSSDAGKSSEEK